VPFVIVDTLLFVSGQVSNGPDGLVRGRLGETMTLEQGQAAARLCAINLISQMKAALGDLERVKRIVKLGGFVNAAADFVEIPKVVNGCSDLMVEAFGDKGRHARSAVACPTLPLGAAVEVDAVVEFA
jgi:enamine deaminase RidA (YjgF/YER057c/UK114 family)